MKNKNGINTEDLDFYELDMERTKFILRDYLRIRLIKIEKYLYYLIKNDMSSLLSEAEFDYAKNLFKIKRKYFNEHFFKKINPQLNDFGPSGITSDVVQGPPQKFYTIIKSNTLENNYLNIKDIYNESTETLSIQREDIVCLPYFLIKDKVEENKYQLI